MKIFNGTIPQCQYLGKKANNYFDQGQQSILSQMIEVDINKLAMNWLETRLQRKSQDISFDTHIRQKLADDKGMQL